MEVPDARTRLKVGFEHRDHGLRGEEALIPEHDHLESRVDCGFLSFGILRRAKGMRSWARAKGR
jgi:hypothetical protein